MVVKEEDKDLFEYLILRELKTMARMKNWEEAFNALSVSDSQVRTPSVTVWGSFPAFLAVTERVSASPPGLNILTPVNLSAFLVMYKNIRSLLELIVYGMVGVGCVLQEISI